MKIYLLFFILSALSFSDVFEVNTFETMISAGKESLNSNQNDTWVFKKDNKILDIKNPTLQEELKKYY